MTYLKSYFLAFITCSLSITIACSDQSGKKNIGTNGELKTFITPLGKEVSYPVPSKNALKQFDEAKKEYLEDSTNAEKIIWYGRRTAYLGRYNDAITIYTKGIRLYPDNPKFYRHRGHRYISIRKYDEAIKDFEIAENLIEGTENEIEQDGMPNALGIPVSTLHGNIYYHLGLAYYLKHEYSKAFDAYIKCRNSGENADNIVSSTHWLYMIQQRMGDPIKADDMLEPITGNMEIIENHDYYTLCKFYKGLIPRDSIQIEGDSPASDAVKYGLANWYFYNDSKGRAKESFEDIVKGNSWTSFGYLAAESDLIEYFNE